MKMLVNIKAGLSNFLPHCASCDTPLPPPGLANLVPGQTLSTNCRQCYLKLSMYPLLFADDYIGQYPSRNIAIDSWSGGLMKLIDIQASDIG